MRLVNIALGVAALLAGCARAQFSGNVAAASVAQCAQGCLVANLGASAGCDSTDYACLCRSGSYVNAVSCCMQKACNSTEQRTAITFTVALCASYNITIPNYLGCNAASATYNTTSISFPSTIMVTALASVTTLDAYIQAYVTTSGGPVGSFSGAPMLTGSCTRPAFAIFTGTPNGTGTVSVTQFPYVGCQNQGCCPFDAGSPGPVTVCPHDYYTVGDGCCPSGWSLATSNSRGPVAGTMTLCATQPAELMVPASTAQNGHAAVYSDVLFSLRYQLGVAPPSTALPTSAVAGIAVGSVAGVLAFSLLGLLAYRARQRRAQEIRNATAPHTPHPAAGAAFEHHEFSPTKENAAAAAGVGIGAVRPGDGGLQQQIVEAPAGNFRSELPSPMPEYPRGRNQLPMGGLGMHPVGAEGFGVHAVNAEPLEMLGSTHMHEHHPALMTQGEGRQAELDGANVGRNEEGGHDEEFAEAVLDGEEEEEEAGGRAVGGHSEDVEDGDVSGAGVHHAADHSPEAEIEAEDSTTRQDGEVTGSERVTDSDQAAPTARTRDRHLGVEQGRVSSMASLFDGMSSMASGWESGEDRHSYAASDDQSGIIFGGASDDRQQRTRREEDGTSRS